MRGQGVLLFAWGGCPGQFSSPTRETTAEAPPLPPKTVWREIEAGRSHGGGRADLRKAPPLQSGFRADDEHYLRGRQALPPREVPPDQALCSLGRRSCLFVAAVFPLGEGCARGSAKKSPKNARVLEGTTFHFKPGPASQKDPRGVTSLQTQWRREGGHVRGRYRGAGARLLP